MKSKLFVIIILFILGFIGSYRLIRPGYFSMQDDIHVFRLEQLDSCLKDGQIPCRYISSGGFGYGYPLFNFYSPLPYYLAEVFHLTGLSYIDSVKTIFIVTSFIRPLGMFLLASLLFGTTGGLISSILFSLAPYQAVNSFVRGTIAENLAIALIPFIFYFFIQRRYLLFSLFITLLSLSHNLTLLYTLPVLTLFIIIFHRRLIVQYFKYIFLGLSLSATFLLPAFFEKSHTTVHTMTQGYFYFVNHFTTLKQLFFDRFWGYGASLWGPVDDMSFQLGYLQWLLPLITLFFFFKQKIVFFFLVGLFALFLTHNRSTFLWNSIPLLPYYQFPWRFLGLAVFSLSLFSGQLSKKFTSQKFVIVILVAGILLNFNYFKEDIWFPKLHDSDKLSQAEIIRQSGAGLKDYWPNYSTDFPTEFASDPKVLTGSAVINQFSKNSHQAVGNITVLSESAFVSLPVVYFPQFILKIDSVVQSFLIDKQTGLITLALVSGDHNFQLDFVDTPIRFVANVISLTSLFIFILLILFRVKQK